MLPIEELEKKLSVNWPNIRTARERSIKKRETLSSLISRYSDADFTVVVFGSLARNEFTDSSDIDWTLLIDGKAKSEHYTIKDEIAKVFNEEGQSPGNEGAFGSLSFSHELIHNIGGDDDTNKNTTRRILLLLESEPISNEKAFERVLKEVLSRYINEDWGVIDKTYRVPRFLLNDIARYWRTMCVDFAHKRRKEKERWALRTTKLRLSRKLIYVSGLLACFSCKNMESDILAASGLKEQRKIIIEHLYSIMRLTPLDILASTILPYESLYDAARQVYSSYDDFLSLLSNKETREHLKTLSPEAAKTDVLYDKARNIGRLFQDGLDKIFFEDIETGLFELTKKYGVF